MLKVTQTLNCPPAKCLVSYLSGLIFLLIVIVLVEVDILKLINVTHKDPGISLVEGPIRRFPAYKFRLPYGNVPLSQSSLVAGAMNNSRGFTVVFLYRLDSFFLA